MVDAEEYVENGSVEWGRVGGAFAGAVLTLVGYAAARWVTLWTDGVAAVLGGLEWFATSLVMLPFEGGTRVLNSAWDGFIAFLPALGPVAFPAAVVMVVVVLSAIYWGVSRVVWSV